MSSLINKVAGILPDLVERGPVYLFALAEREDIGLWDVILSSEWSDQDWTGAIRYIIDLLWPVLEESERMLIARIAVVPSSSSEMQQLPASLDDVDPEDSKVIYVSLLGSDVRRAFIYKAQIPPPTLAERSLAGAMASHP